MNELNNMLSTLLRSVICGERLDQNELEGLDVESIDKLYKLSKANDMAHVVGLALNNAGLLNDERTTEKFTKHQLVAVHRYENTIYEQDRIFTVLNEHKIPFIPLKGSIIRELYPEPWMRTSCDIDVLVKESDVDRAAEALAASLGYEIDPRKSVHDILLKAESGVQLELHYNLNEGIQSIDRVLKRVWEYASATQNGSEYRLTDEFFMYHFIAHASYHFVNGGCGFRTICDMWLLMQSDRYDKEKLLDLCRDGGVETLYLALSRLAEAWFGKREHDPTTKRMEKYIVFGGTYGISESKIAARREARGGKIGYLLSRVFVSYRHLKFKYPSLKTRALVPVYQVRRWIDMLREKKLSKYAGEFNTNQSLSDEKIAEVCSLMRDLDLNKMIK